MSVVVKILMQVSAIDFAAVLRLAHNKKRC